MHQISKFADVDVDADVRLRCVGDANADEGIKLTAVTRRVTRVSGAIAFKSIKSV